MSSAPEERNVIVIAGATATGKTALGESLAEALDGVVICADARQVFAPLDIGTGKPTAAERAARPHELFDWRRLGEATNAGAWAREAARCCEAAFACGRVPVLVGGSGLYLRALIDGLHGEPGSDEAVRAELEESLARNGLAALRTRLEQLDPVTAARLAPNDRQRVVRALEVALVTGRPLSERHAAPRHKMLEAHIRAVQLVVGPAPLNARIHARTTRMFEEGLLAEVAGLVAAGQREALLALRAIGYDEALAHIEGTCTLEEAIARTEARTRQLARRQRTWFRHQLTAAVLDADSTPESGLLREALRMTQGRERGV